MRIIVTGSHGFVGRNLVPFLKQKGHTVSGLGRFGEYTWADIDTGKMPAADAIVHLAGKAHDTKNATEAKVYFDVNYGLTVKAFDYFLSHEEIKTFIFFSSVKAAADKVEGPSLTEDVAPRPVGPYGESKAKAEAYILSRMAECGRRHVYILRPCMMHGPGNKGNLNLLYKVVRLGLPWPLGAFENKRSFCSIKNVCFVVNALLDEGCEAENGIYNLADDEALSTNELVGVICNAVGKPVRIWHMGKGLMTVAARLGDRLHLPLNTERLAKLTENYIVANTKIKRVLGITTMPVSTRDGLRYTLENFNND